jgi:transposase InsO family protein
VVAPLRRPGGELGVAFAALCAELGGPVLRPVVDPAAGAVTAIGCAFAAACEFPGWAGLGRWRFASAASGGRLLAANMISPYLVVGRRRFLPPVGETASEPEEDMDRELIEQVALHRWGVIAQAVNPRLTPAERGALVRVIAARPHAHPDGSVGRYSRGTIDRWLRVWRGGGLAGLRPEPRADTGTVRAHPELFAEAAALRLELPARSAAQIASILFHRHGIRVAERTRARPVAPGWAAPRGVGREPKVFGRYEAEHPNDRWVTDVLVGPWVPLPRREGSVRARLFLIVDDHSRLLVDGEFFAHENVRACQALLRRAIVRRGVPTVLYAGNGAPFANAWLARTCALLGIRLVHSKPYSPQGRGKQERLNRYIREAFLAEACHQGIDSIDELNDRVAAWASRWPTGADTPRPGRRRSSGSRPAARPDRSTPPGWSRRSAGR